MLEIIVEHWIMSSRPYWPVKLGLSFSKNAVLPFLRSVSRHTDIRDHNYLQRHLPNQRCEGVEVSMRMSACHFTYGHDGEEEATVVLDEFHFRTISTWFKSFTKNCWSSLFAFSCCIDDKETERHIPIDRFCKWVFFSLILPSRWRRLRKRIVFH